MRPLPAETKESLEKAIKETIAKVMENSLSHRTATLDPTDLAGLQKIVADKRKMQGLANTAIHLPDRK